MNKQNSKEDFIYDPDGLFPFYDTDPRRALENFSKMIKEEPINTGPYKDGQIEVSPLTLTLTIMLVARNHLNLILDYSSKSKIGKIGLEINKEQKTKLYLELLTLYYFLTTSNIMQYLEGNQFTLFALKLHVELLDNLPKTRDTWWLFGINPFTRAKKIREIVGEDSWKTGLSANILDGERFYIKDRLRENEVQVMERLKKIVLDSSPHPERFKNYEKNMILQFMVKSIYRIGEALDLFPKNIFLLTIVLYTSISMGILEFQKQLGKHMKPAWHHEK